tara:strand:+ start:2130 stop:2342 length:213 start_codon:yes stop_codon:yes gene_type:complete
MSTNAQLSNILRISSDCHADALPATYLDHMPTKYHEAADHWWLDYAKEMIQGTGTFFDQEALEEFSELSG